MPEYRRNYDGRVFFFTLVAARRSSIFACDNARSAIGNIIRRTANDRPFVTEAIVLLPDHLHMMWRMEADDMDYSMRISIIKKRFTRWYLAQDGNEIQVPEGQKRHRFRGVWQRRFWEHTIRDANDWRRHVDYIHANPVKHGLADRPCDWPWSSFGRYVEAGLYKKYWCGQANLSGAVEYRYIE